MIIPTKITIGWACWDNHSNRNYLNFDMLEFNSCQYHVCYHCAPNKEIIPTPWTVLNTDRETVFIPLWNVSSNWCCDWKLMVELTVVLYHGSSVVVTHVLSISARLVRQCLYQSRAYSSQTTPRITTHYTIHPRDKDPRWKGQPHTYSWSADGRFSLSWL